MKEVCVVPVWLSEFLKARHLPVDRVADENWLSSILSGPDVKSYDIAQRLMSSKSRLNILQPLFTKNLSEDYNYRSWCPELFYDVPRGEEKAFADVVFYRALVFGASYESSPVTKEQAQFLDFDVELHGDTLFVIAKCVSSSILEPSIRAATLDRVIHVLRTCLPLEKVAANEIFSRWLRETSLAKGAA